LQEEDEKLQEG